MESRTDAPAGAPPARRDHAAPSAPTPPCCGRCGPCGALPSPTTTSSAARCHHRHPTAACCGLGGVLGVALVAAVLLQVLTAPVHAAKSHVFEKPAKGPDNPPRFHAPIVNESAPVSREAVLTCLVDDLGNYKVAWLRVDTQTILTIASHVITKNHRIGVSQSDPRTWKVHIKDVRESDRGWYMCQINTDPMKSQQGYLDVVVPPDILDYPTSTDLVVRELSNATLRCVANGSPQPNITWKREGGAPLYLPSGKEVMAVEGQNYTIPRVTREHMGAYLCIASNGVPPSVSKRIFLTVEFPPVIEVPSQLVGARVGRQLVLQCLSQAFPKSINYWVRGDNTLVKGPGYQTETIDSAYSISMRLTIKSVALEDLGEYKCVSKNYLGETEQSIKVDHVKTPDWGLSSTKLPKHTKGKYLGRPVSENSVEIPDAEESTASSSPAPRGTANVFLLVTSLLWISCGKPVARL